LGFFDLALGFVADLDLDLLARAMNGLLLRRLPPDLKREPMNRNGACDFVMARPGQIEGVGEIRGPS